MSNQIISQAVPSNTPRKSTKHARHLRHPSTISRLKVLMTDSGLETIVDNVTGLGKCMANEGKNPIRPLVIACKGVTCGEVLASFLQ